MRLDWVIADAKFAHNPAQTVPVLFATTSLDIAGGTSQVIDDALAFLS